MRSGEHLEEGEGHPGNTDMGTGRHRSGHGTPGEGGGARGPPPASQAAAQPALLSL